MCFNHIGHGRLKPGCFLLACLDSQLQKRHPHMILFLHSPYGGESLLGAGPFVG